jgi:hypothetical protein
MRTTSLLLAAALGLGCQANGGLPYDRVHVAVVDDSGATSEAVPPDHCLTLPVLMGSRVRHDFRLDSRLDLNVDADRDGVTVSFVGSSVRRRIGVNELADSHVRVEVKSAEGRDYEVTLEGRCPVAPDGGSP